MEEMRTDKIRMTSRRGLEIGIDHQQKGQNGYGLFFVSVLL
jgi:hypothetical protein